MPIWRNQVPDGSVTRSCANASRCQGMGARLKYSALPLASRTSLTQFGSNNSCVPAIDVASVASSVPAAASVSATARTAAAGASGSSPCRFTTMRVSGQPFKAAHSARRSVPEVCAAEVMQTATSSGARASAMRASSVATTTSLAPASRARLTTCTIIGSPAMSRSGLPGKRVDAWRAGMATTKSRLELIGSLVARRAAGHRCRQRTTQAGSHRPARRRPQARQVDGISPHPSRSSGSEAAP